jgi:hypothetical protein
MQFGLASLGSTTKEPGSGMRSTFHKVQLPSKYYDCITKTFAY